MITVRLRALFPLLAVMLLAPWPAAYAYEQSSTASPPDVIQIRSAEPSSGWRVFDRAIGSVDTPIDLFYIDITGKPADSSCTLYLTNSSPLSHCYRYLILKMGVYVRSGSGSGGWARASSKYRLNPDVFITLLNAQVSLTLPGADSYKIAIDSGSYYAFAIAHGQGSVAPQFYLTVE